MCGRFASSLPAAEMARLFTILGELPNPRPTWNLAPSQSAPIVRRHPQTGERRLNLLRWGLIPSWTKDIKAARKPINARSKTAGSSGMFKGAVASRRCIIPADLFYEWQALPDGKQPFAINRTDGEPLTFAGIWEGWRSPDGEVMRTFAIMTTAANREMSTIHERMPVVLERGAWGRWLGEDEGDVGELMRPAPDGTLRMWRVSRRVNSVRNDGVGLIAPVGEDEGPGGGPNPA